MHPDRVEKLRQEYSDELVVVDPTRADLARFAGMTGRVKTVNFNGRALVEFDGNGNRGWYDIELDYLKVVDPPDTEPAGPPRSEARGPSAEAKLSPLELARMAKQRQQKRSEEAARESPPHNGATPAGDD